MEPVMKKTDVVRAILGERFHMTPSHTVGKAFAPTNIALCKYWGKRNQELNLPVTSSLSVSLGDKGATAEIKIHHEPEDMIILNGESVSSNTSFSKKLIAYLNLFRPAGMRFHITLQSNIPIAAGLASSACGFASIICALDKLFDWKLAPQQLSILARLGSGSASRSVWSGFVEWHAGIREDGMDSHGEMIAYSWPDLCVGLLILNQQEKIISSREAMQCTVQTSALYAAWPSTVNRDLQILKEAIQDHDFHRLGCAAESNALAMHATMLSAWPPIQYALPETLLAMQTVWALRQAGVPLYFTQDAGPNLKLLFLKSESDCVRHSFPAIDIVQPFICN
jgi:diphosphomevalonate decarboxylase